MNESAIKQAVKVNFCKFIISDIKIYIKKLKLKELLILTLKLTSVLCSSIHKLNSLKFLLDCMKKVLLYLYTYALCMILELKHQDKKKKKNSSVLKLILLFIILEIYYNIIFYIL